MIDKESSTNELKEKELDLWRKWMADRTNATLKPLLTSLKPIIDTHATKMTGNLPKSAIRAQMTQLVIDNLPNYNPEKSQLNTFLYNTAGMKLHRYVYEHQNLGTIPEPRIIQIGTYKKVRTNMEDELGRPPTSAELADELKWGKKQVELLEKEMRKDLVQDFSFINISEDNRSDIDENLLLLHSELFGQDKQVMEYLYGLEGKPSLTNSEISSKLGISQRMVTQIKNKIASRLKASGALSGY